MSDNPKNMGTEIIRDMLENTGFIDYPVGIHYWSETITMSYIELMASFKGEFLPYFDADYRWTSHLSLWDNTKKSLEK